MSEVYKKIIRYFLHFHRGFFAVILFILHLDDRGIFFLISLRVIQAIKSGCEWRAQAPLSWIIIIIVIIISRIYTTKYLLNKWTAPVVSSMHTHFQMLWILSTKGRYVWKDNYIFWDIYANNEKIFYIQYTYWNT